MVSAGLCHNNSRQGAFIEWFQLDYVTLTLCGYLVTGSNDKRNKTSILREHSLQGFI